MAWFGGAQEGRFLLVTFRDGLVKSRSGMHYVILVKARIP
jgi:hypothetical protein